MVGNHLLITCHPSRNSLCARIAQLVTETLKSRQIEVIVDDLTAQGFCGVISSQELSVYLENVLPSDIAVLVEHLRAAEELTFIFPVWMYGMPALLKGYFDRVWRPYVSFTLEEASIRPLLWNIKHLTVVATHGMNKNLCDRVGDTSQMFFARSLPSVLPNLLSNTRLDLYGMDIADECTISYELERIRMNFLQDRQLGLRP
jgi:putative NADPH-quinone reductase